MGDIVQNIDAPASSAFAITPDDSNDLARNTRALFVGVTGNINVDMVGGQTVLFSNVPVGIFPIRVKRVRSTSTTATSIVGLL